MTGADLSATDGGASSSLSQGAGPAGLLRFWTRRKPECLALADPPNKKKLGLGPPRRLSFIEADAAVDRIAGRLIASGLASGDIVAVQLPHVSETILTLIACLRAGLTAAPVPFAWRRREIAAALGAVPVRAAIGCWAREGLFQSHVLTACSEVETRRCFAFAFAEDGPDGLQILDDAIDNDIIFNSVTPSREMPPPSTALLSFSPGRGQTMQVIPRTEQELIAAGLSVSLELGLSGDGAFLSAFPPSGITGLAGFLMPWLITGSTLHLHHPFDAASFRRQLVEEKVTYTALPHALFAEWTAFSALAFPASLRCAASVVPLPPATSTYEQIEAPFPVFVAQPIAEYALAVRRADSLANPAALPLGRVATAETSGQPVIFLETRLKGRPLTGAGQPVLSGTLALRGAAVPSDWEALARFNPHRSLTKNSDGFLNTGLPCAVTGAAMNALACMPEEGVMRHGGVAIDIEELDGLYAGFPDFLDAAAFTIADPIMGERIFAAVVPPPGEGIAEADFRDYLEELDVAPFKMPEKLVAVRLIPRDEVGRVLRARILDEI